MMTTAVLVLEPSLVEPLSMAGLDVTLAPRPARDELARAPLVAMGPEWGRLRDWRLGGCRFAALVWSTAEPPEPRGNLEPMVLVGSLEPDAVRDAVARLQQGLRQAEVPLRRGMLDLRRGELTTPDGLVRLSARETELLGYLAVRADRFVPRQELLTEVFGCVESLNTRMVDMAVARLRKKVEIDPAHPVNLVTGPRGRGYRLLLDLEPASAPVGFVPVPVRPIVGRDGLLRRLVKGVEDGSRWQALVGPPGVGKTRLAVELARRDARSGRWPGGAWFVDLAGRTDAASALHQIAQVLGLPTGQQPIIDSVLSELARREPLLLVLDPLEHLGAAFADVVDTLASTEGVQVLTTSQCRLGGAAEVVVLVPPLAPHDASAMLRSRVLDLGVDVEPDDARALARRLDHLPLAIEVVAPRLRVASAAMLAAEAGLPAWLEGSGAGPGQRSLGAALEWAWSVLTDELRDALGELASLRGPFTLEEAASLRGRDASSTARHLETLLDRSLVRRLASETADSERPAFVLLEVVAHWVRAKFPSSSVHARWVLGWAECDLQAVGLLPGPTSARRGEALVRATQRLTRRLPDLEAAFEAVETESEKTRLALAIDVVHQQSGDVAQRLRRLEAVRSTVTNPRDRAWLGLALAGALCHTRRLVDEIAVRRRAIEEAESAGERNLGARLRTGLAHALLQRGDTEQFMVEARRAIADGDDIVRAHLDCFVRLRLARLGREQPPAAHGPFLWRNLDHLEAEGHLQAALSAALAVHLWASAYGTAQDFARIDARLNALAAVVPAARARTAAVTISAQAILARGHYQRTVDRLAPLLAESGVPPDAESTALRLVATAQAHLGEVGAARSTLGRLEQLIHEVQDPIRRAYAGLLDGVLRLHEGDLDGARAQARAADEAATNFELVSLRPQGALIRALAALLEGDPGAAREELASVAKLPMSEPTRCQWRGARAVAAHLESDATELSRLLPKLRPAHDDVETPASASWTSLTAALANADHEALGELASGRPNDAVVRMLARAALGAAPDRAGFAAPD